MRLYRQWIALGTIFSFSNTQPVMTFNHKGAAVRIQKSIYFLNLDIISSFVVFTNKHFFNRIIQTHIHWQSDCLSFIVKRYRVGNHY
jgi:hypothetical protein